MLLDPLTDPRWSALVDRAPATTIFHHPAWLALLRGEYGYAFAAVGVQRDGELVAGLPVALVSSRVTGRRLVALPFSDLCAPLTLARDDPEALAELGRAVEEHRAALGLGLEVREAFPQLPGAIPVERFYVHEIDLEADDSFTSMTRRNVRKAARAGVTIERRTDRDALDTFYGLHRQTRRRQGVPTQRRRFVRAFETLFQEGLGFVALARIDGATVAAAVFAGAGRTLTYKYGASDRSALDVRPNNLLFSEVIGWARADGYRALDLGRTDLDNEGLRAFKAGWGAGERMLAYTYAGREAPTPGAPPGPARRALEQVVTRSPAVVGQAIGAALYRHVG